MTFKNKIYNYIKYIKINTPGSYQIADNMQDLVLKGG